jgi:hypothetical protein
VLSLVDHGVSQTRQTAGLGRQRLRMAMPPTLPETLTFNTASALQSAAAAADAEVVWVETPLDAEFSPVRQRQADAGLGWLTASPDALPAALDAMSLGEFEPDLWIPASHPAARRGSIGLDELARMDVIHGPRRAEPGHLRCLDQHHARRGLALPVHRPAAAALVGGGARLRRNR